MDGKKVRTCSLTDKPEMNWRDKLETTYSQSQNEKIEADNTQKQQEAKIFKTPSVPQKRKVNQEQSSVKRVRQ